MALRVVSIKVPENLLEQYDAEVANRSENIREHMRKTVGNKSDDGRQPPNDGTLAEAWHTLVNLSNANNWVTEVRAENILAQRHSLPMKEVRRSILRPLEKRGYVNRTTDQYGQQAAYQIYE